MARCLSAIVFCVIFATALSARPWLGEWASVPTRTPPENLDAFLTALGLPLNKFGSTARKIIGEPLVDLVQLDSNRFSISFTMPTDMVNQTHACTLGEESSYNDKLFKNAEVKYTCAEDGDKLKVEIKIPSINKVIHDTYEVVGDQLVKTFEVDGIKGKRYFKKIGGQMATDSLGMQRRRDYRK